MTLILEPTYCDPSSWIKSRAIKASQALENLLPSSSFLLLALVTVMQPPPHQSVKFVHALGAGQCCSAQNTALTIFSKEFPSQLSW